MLIFEPIATKGSKATLPSIKRHTHNQSVVHHRTDANQSPLLSKNSEEKEEYMKQRMRVVEHKRQKQIKANLKLSEKLFAVERERDALRARMKDVVEKETSGLFKKQIEQYESTQKKHEEIVNDLKKKLRHFKNQEMRHKQDVMAVLKNKDGEIARLKQKFEEKLKVKEKVIDKLKLDLANCEMELHEKSLSLENREIENSQIVVKASEHNVKEMQDNLKKYQEIIKELKVKIEQYKDDYLRECLSKKSLNKELNAKTVEIDNLQTMYDSTKLELMAAKTENHELLVNNMQLKKTKVKEQDVLNYDEEHAQTERIISSLKTTNTKLLEETRSLKAKVTDLELKLQKEKKE